LLGSALYGTKKRVKKVQFGRVGERKFGRSLIGIAWWIGGYFPKFPKEEDFGFKDFFNWRIWQDYLQQIPRERGNQVLVKTTGKTNLARQEGFQYSFGGWGQLDTVRKNLVGVI